MSSGESSSHGGLSRPKSRRERRSEKINEFKKKMESPPIVFQGKVWKTRKGMIRRVCENRTAGSGVGYVWGRC